MSHNNLHELAAIEAAVGSLSVFNSVSTFRSYLQMAEMLARCTILPEDYRNNPANCLIAIDIANRANMPVITVMQNLQVINGKPGWSAKYVLAVLNTSGRYESDVQFEWQSLQGAYDYGCRAWATLKGTEIKVTGPWVTWQMVTDEGWNRAPDSKWNTMQELMFQYRAATFFGNLRASDLLLGIPTVEELFDIAAKTTTAVATGAGKSISFSDASQLANAIKNAELPAPVERTPTVETEASPSIAHSTDTRANQSAVNAAESSQPANSGSTTMADGATPAGETPDLLALAAGTKPEGSAGQSLATVPATVGSEDAAGTAPAASSGKATAGKPRTTTRKSAATKQAEQAAEAASTGSAPAAPVPAQATPSAEFQPPVPKASNATPAPSPAPAGRVKCLISDLAGFRHLLLGVNRAVDFSGVIDQIQFLGECDRVSAIKDAYETAMEFIPEENSPEGMKAISTLLPYLTVANDIETFRATFNGRIEVLREQAAKK